MHQPSKNFLLTRRTVMFAATHSVLILRFVEALLRSLDHIRVELVASMDVGVLEALEGLVIHHLKSSENLAVVVEERLDLIQVVRLLMMGEVVKPEVLVLDVLEFVSINGNMSLIEDGLMLVILLSIDLRLLVGVAFLILKDLLDVLHGGVITLVLIWILRCQHRVNKIRTSEHQGIVEFGRRFRR